MRIHKIRNQAIVAFLELTDDQFKRLFFSVLDRIPNEFEKDFPMFCVREGTAVWGAYVSDEGSWYDVVFDLDRLERKSGGRNDVKRGVIAHELAHVDLEHLRDQDGLSSLEAEDEADSLASEWGFEDEIIAFREMFGAATVESIY